MFIVMLTYLQPLEVVDQYLVEHRAFLDQGYQQKLLIASGPQVPREGGILIAANSNRSELEAFLLQDPFCIHKVAEYKIIEFTPVKYAPALQEYIC